MDGIVTVAICWILISLYENYRFCDAIPPQLLVCNCSIDEQMNELLHDASDMGWTWECTRWCDCLIVLPE